MESSLLDFLKSGFSGRLGDISVIVTNHFLEESFGLVLGGEWEALVLHNLDNQHALLVQLGLDLLLVLPESVSEFLVLWVLLDGANGSNCSSLRSDEVLETNRE